VYGVKAVANDIEVKPGTSRSDPEIATDIVQAMRINVVVPDDKLKITTREGFVTLEGEVDRYFQRDVAEGCARNVAGVRGITNLIEVKPKPATASSGELRAKIEDALKRMPR